MVGKPNIRKKLNFYALTDDKEATSLRLIYFPPSYFGFLTFLFSWLKIKRWIILFIYNLDAENWGIKVTSPHQVKLTVLNINVVNGKIKKNIHNFEIFLKDQ